MASYRVVTKGLGTLAFRADDVDPVRDRARVERFQAGDGAAFDELYRRYWRRLLRYCLKRVGHHETAEEIAQEAFTRALGAMSNFTGERRFYPWVTVIASRLCIDHFRRLERVQTIRTLDLRRVDGDQDAVLAAIDTELVAEAMERLRCRHQDVLRLREIEGWSYQQIADEYGVSSRTIDALLFRARRALRREFEAVGGTLASVPFFGRLGHVGARIRDRSATLVALSPGTVAVGVTAAVATAALTFVPTAEVRARSPHPTAPLIVKTTAVTSSAAGPSSPGSAGPAASSIPRDTTAGDAQSSHPSPAGVVPGLSGAAGILTLPGLQALMPTALSPVPHSALGPLGEGPISQTLTTTLQRPSAP
jgi:RNA polymerase sigma factor (sigma-70 family)